MSQHMPLRTRPLALLTVALLTGLGLAVTSPATAGAASPAGSASSARTLAPGTRFYVNPDSFAAKQARTDLFRHDLADATAMAKLASWPGATWFGDDTPAQVNHQVKDLVRKAAAQRSVPVLVAYDIPLRDCSQYSAGGAQSDADYQAWIAAFAKGLGRSKAVVVLEPDALANLPSDCGPTTDPTGALSAGRLADLRYAVGVLEAQPGTSVYLDAGNSHWLAVGDAASRLIQAGVAQAQGFSLNVSSTQPTAQSDQYGGWVAKCIWFATQGPAWAAGHTNYCASQYYSASAPNDALPGDKVSANDYSTWHWTDAWFDKNVGTPPADQLTHFVVDTSRNGQGVWTPTPGKYAGDPQTWCNAPGRGIGDRPTADTQVPLVDAYLYVKTIGTSDGQCNRSIPGGTIDPEYGSVDPVAGAWWPQMALSLVKNADPVLTFNRNR